NMMLGYESEIENIDPEFQKRINFIREYLSRLIYQEEYIIAQRDRLLSLLKSTTDEERRTYIINERNNLGEMYNDIRREIDELNKELKSLEMNIPYERKIRIPHT